MKTDITAVSALVAFVITGINVVEDAGADGHYGIEDAGLLLKFVPIAGPAFQNIGQVVPELKLLTSEDLEDLATQVAAQLENEPADVKALLPAAFKTLEGIADAVQYLRSKSAATPAT